MGDWAVTYDEVYLGDTYAGMALASITEDKMSARIRESWRGENGAGTIAGKYTVQPNCMIRWNYSDQDKTFSGVVHGIIVSANKMFLVYSNPDLAKSGRAIAERVQYAPN